MKACAENSVERITITKQELMISFFAGSKAPENTAIQSEPQATPNAPSGDFEPLPLVPQDPKKLDEDDELAELRITNPLEFEERLIKGELVDAETQDD